MPQDWSAWLQPAGIEEIRGEVPPEMPRALCTDSRAVTPGALFIALPGTRSDGEAFIPQALARGAAGIIHFRELPEYAPQVFYLRLRDPRAAVSLLCRAAAGFPDQKLSLFGVTGTNGKTTSVYLFHALLTRCEDPCGLVSTVEYCDGKNSFPPTHTTPDPQTLYPLLAQMVQNHLSSAAMEFSSHALAQNRLAGIRVKTAVFTNLTGDHLDFHKDMEHYFEAKKRLFSELLVSGGNAVINADDPYGKQLISFLRERRSDLHIVSFGTSPEAEYRIGNPFSDAEGSRFRLRCPDGRDLPVSTFLPGSYNIHNLTGVLVSLLLAGIAPAMLQRALQKPIRVPGRLELFHSPAGTRFYVDYAHTDDALTNVLQTLRPCTKGKLTVLFGAGGDRDRTKRPRMGRAAARWADKVIVTSDNPRSEDPEAIIAEILSGIPGEKETVVEADRRKAIRLAVRTAGPEDIVLIAGKGHENTQTIRGIAYPFDDREELKQAFLPEGKEEI